jgi:esterase/lipase
MKNLTPKMLVESAKEAVAIGKSIGEKVILMGCSTGGTLAIYLAAGDQDLESIILLSPNIELKSAAATLMTGPWGRQLAYQLIGEHRDLTSFQNAKPYWSYIHHTNGLIALQSLMDQTMQERYFKQIKIPVYCGYYYKNENVQDPVVSIDAILEFQKDIATPVNKTEFEAFESGNHVLGSIYKNDHWEEVQKEVLSFIYSNTNVRDDEHQ